MGQKKGRPKKRWKEVLECDVIVRSLQAIFSDLQRSPKISGPLSPSQKSAGSHLGLHLPLNILLTESLASLPPFPFFPFSSFGFPFLPLPFLSSAIKFER